MSEQDFLPFGIAGGANVIDQATYQAALAAGFVGVGFAAGLAESAKLNKVWRQSSVMAYVMGQFISDTLGIDVLDNSDTATLLANFKSAVGIAGGVGGILLVTASTTLALTALQKKVALQRSVSPAAQQITLAPNAGLPAGFSQRISDMQGNLQAFPVTVVPSAGTISGRANYVMNEDYQSALFTYYGSNVWGVES